MILASTVPYQNVTYFVCWSSHSFLIANNDPSIDFSLDNYFSIKFKQNFNDTKKDIAQVWSLFEIAILKRRKCKELINQSVKIGQPPSLISLKIKII